METAWQCRQAPRHGRHRRAVCLREPRNRRVMSPRDSKPRQGRRRAKGPGTRRRRDSEGTGQGMRRRRTHQGRPTAWASHWRRNHIHAQTAGRRPQGRANFRRWPHHQATLWRWQRRRPPGRRAIGVRSCLRLATRGLAANGRARQRLHRLLARPGCHAHRPQGRGRRALRRRHPRNHEHVTRLQQAPGKLPGNLEQLTSGSGSAMGPVPGPALSSASGTAGGAATGAGPWSTAAFAQPRKLQNAGQDGHSPRHNNTPTLCMVVRQINTEPAAVQTSTLLEIDLKILLCRRPVATHILGIQQCAEKPLAVCWET